MAVQSFSELIVWRKGMDLVEAIYRSTATFPKDELFGLTSQLRRAAVSVPSNIAEGQGRRSTREFLHHLSIAYGSLCEAKTQILIAGRLGYLVPREIERLIELVAKVAKLLNGLSRSLSKRL